MAIKSIVTNYLKCRNIFDIILRKIQNDDYSYIKICMHKRSGKYYVKKMKIILGSSEIESLSLFKIFFNVVTLIFNY